MEKERERTTGIRRPNSGITIDIKRLKRLREEKTWSRQMLGRKAGISPQTVAKLETGDRRPKPATLAALCDALGCEPTDLLAPL